MDLSINELSKLTGRDRRTITDRLSGLTFKEGEKGAHLYDSADALLSIYTEDPDRISLDRARTRQALSQERLNDTRNQSLRKQRIPLELVLSVLDQALQSFGGTLKAAKDEKLTNKKINELLDKLREVPATLKWIK